MKIDRADPSQQKRTLLWLLVLALPTFLLLDHLEAYLQGLDVDALGGALPLMTTVLYLMSLPLLFACYYQWRVGRRIVREGRFPLVGSKILRDTVVLEGQSAIRRGRMLQLLTLVLALVFLLMPALIVAVLKSVLSL